MAAPRRDSVSDSFPYPYLSAPSPCAPHTPLPRTRTINSQPRPIPSNLPRLINNPTFAMYSGPRSSNRASPSLHASPPPSNKPVDKALLVGCLGEPMLSANIDLSVLLYNRPPIHRPAHLRRTPVPIAPAPTLIKHPANRCNTVRPSCSPAFPPITTDPKPVPISSPASVVKSPSLAPVLLPIARPVPRRMATPRSHWSFSEKARFDAALKTYGGSDFVHIAKAVGTRTQKQVKGYAARDRIRKTRAAKMDALAIQQQQQQPVVQAITPEQRQAHSKHCPAPPLRPKNEGAVGAPELKDIPQEPSTNWIDNWPMDDVPLFSGGLFSDSMLESTGKDTDPLSDGPSEDD